MILDDAGNRFPPKDGQQSLNRAFAPFVRSGFKIGLLQFKPTLRDRFEVHLFSIQSQAEGLFSHLLQTAFCQGLIVGPKRTLDLLASHLNQGIISSRMNSIEALIDAFELTHIEIIGLHYRVIRRNFANLKSCCFER